METVDSIKEKFGFVEDQELAELFDRGATAVSNWRSNGKLPLAIEKKAEQLLKEKGLATTNTETIFIPLFNVEASAGGGSLVEEENVVDRIAFKEEWLRDDLGVNPDDLAMITTIGDSMEPTLRSGDMVLLDKSVGKIKDEAIYAMSVDGMLLIKRVRWRPDGGLTLLSDNNEYETVIIAPDMKETLRVVGRLMWSGRRL